MKRWLGWALLAAACGVSAQTLRWTSQGDPQTMDPDSQNESLTNMVNGQIYERLTNRDAKLAIVPGLAASWTQTGPLTWRFKLRPGVKFHSGVNGFTPTRDLTAEDVIWSFDRQWKPDHPYAKVSAGSYDYFNDMGMPDLLDSITKGGDDYTVVFKLKKPNAPIMKSAVASRPAIAPATTRKRSPYAPELPHCLYSLSKSFTSTAVGLAAAEGRLSLDDRVISFFPESSPSQVSDHLAAMIDQHGTVLKACGLGTFGLGTLGLGTLAPARPGFNQTADAPAGGVTRHAAQRAQAVTGIVGGSGRIRGNLVRRPGKQLRQHHQTRPGSHRLAPLLQGLTQRRLAPTTRLQCRHAQRVARRIGLDASLVVARGQHHHCPVATVGQQADGAAGEDRLVVGVGVEEDRRAHGAVLGLAPRVMM